MKQSKKLAVLTAVFIAISVLAGCAVQKNTTIATVNGEAVLAEDFPYFFRAMQDTMIQEANITDPAKANEFWESTEIDGKKAEEVARERALDELVKMVITVQKAKEQGLTLTSEEEQDVKTQKNNYVQQWGGREAYLTQLENMGMTEKAFERFLERMAYYDKMSQKLIEEDERYTISDEAAIAHIKDSGKVSAKHILFMTVDPQTQEPLSEEEKAAKKQQAEDTLRRLQAGEDFDTLMNQLSEDTGLAQYPNGYTFGEGEMVAPFEEAAFALEEGQLSGIVESNFGYHIIKRVQPDETEIQNAIAEMRADLFEEELETWKNEATIEVNEKELAKYDVVKYDESQSTGTPDTIPAEDGEAQAAQ